MRGNMHIKDMIYTIIKTGEDYRTCCGLSPEDRHSSKAQESDWLIASRVAAGSTDKVMGRPITR